MVAHPITAITIQALTFTGDGSRHMEYVRDRGSFTDLPLEQILAAFMEAYPGLLERDDDVEDEAFAHSRRA